MTKMERVHNWNSNFMKWNGISENGDFYKVLGNTYDIKDSIKKDGGKFSRELGWVFNREVPGYDLVKMNISEVAEKNFDGKYFFKDDVFETVKAIEKANTHYEETSSQFLGTVGSKLGATVAELVNSKVVSTVYGDMEILTFKDIDGNTIVWKTSPKDDLKIGMVVQINGIIKDHSEFRGDKQTVITRAKIIVLSGPDEEEF